MKSSISPDSTSSASIYEGKTYPPPARDFLASLDSVPCLPDHLSGEELLLARLAGTHLNSERIEGFLNSKLNWQLVKDRAYTHGLAPLLYHQLKGMDPTLVPPEVHHDLKRSHKTCLQARMVAGQQFRDISSNFNRQGIALIPLKGLALADTVYPDLALRPSNDLDLFIARKDLDQAKRALKQLGYTENRACFPNQVSRGLKVTTNFVQNHKLPLDVHWHIIRPPYNKYVPVDDLWRNAVSESLYGIDTLVFSPEYQLLHSCFHFAKHGYWRLLWLVDISELIHSYREMLDWRVIVNKTQEYRIERLIHRVLSIVKAIYNSPMPDFVLEDLEPPSLRSLEDYVFSSLANPKVGPTKWILARFLALDEAGKKLRYIFGTLFPNKEFMRHRYPEKSLYLSYPLRLGKGLWDTLKIFFRSLNRD